MKDKNHWLRPEYFRYGCAEQSKGCDLFLSCGTYALMALTTCVLWRQPSRGQVSTISSDCAQVLWMHSFDTSGCTPQHRASFTSVHPAQQCLFYCITCHLCVQNFIHILMGEWALIWMQSLKQKRYDMSVMNLTGLLKLISICETLDTTNTL
jgi:hypothetical protein